jgi:hypothetical protein
LVYIGHPERLAILVHISPWEATVGLVDGAARLLPAGAPLILYGPYLQRDVETAPSNLAFDESLRSRDPRWGLRQVEDLAALALARGFTLEAMHLMPANNLSLMVGKR